MDNPSGTYLHLQRLSTEDGPGIRTTVFLKGCLLRCEWCHNPESLSLKPEVQRIETNCLRCGACIKACPQRCLQADDDNFVWLDRERCDACGACVIACPSGAWEMLGTLVDADSLSAELIKDQSFFRTSEGGVTLSGGEPAIQADFCAALAVRLREVGIHIALDTCGMTSWRNLEKILPFVDMVLYDLKEINPRRHKDFTGQMNEVILQNLLALREYIDNQAPNLHLWVRTPLIPGATAAQENLLGIGNFLAGHLGGMVERWELCTFNNLCQDKYRRLGLEWTYRQTPLIAQNELDQLESWARSSNFPDERVISTGATRLEI